MSQLNVGKIVSSTGIVFPQYTTATRPTSPDLGFTIYNTTTKSLEIWNGTTWVRVGGTSVEASGGNVSTFGNYKIHTFNTIGTSTFTINSSATLDILIVGGGGGGGSSAGNNSSHGAGGGGGVVYKTNYSIASGSYTIVVGDGGLGNVSPSNANGQNGQNSSFGTLVALGGGGGCGGNYNERRGNDGGSGGGSQHTTNTTYTPGGTGLQPNSASGGFGNPGGRAPESNVGGPNWGGGGGGGAGGAGGNGTPQIGGAGGVGIQLDITGTPTFYAGGGGGGAYDAPANGGSVGAGGTGGGGPGGFLNNPAPAGSPNTGGGGGGCGYQATGGKGGSGIVIVRYSTV